MTFTRLILCLGLALTGCTDEGAAQISGQTTPWVAPLPAPIQLSWWKPGSNCLPIDQGCEEPVPFRISAMTCDGCDVMLRSPAGFTTPTADELSTLRADTFTVYAAPHIIGAISFSADLESTSGTHQSVSLSGTGDRVIAIAGTCMQRYDQGTGEVPCGATRAPTDDISITVSATTAGTGELPLTDLLIDGDEGNTVNSVLPTMSPDAANWSWGDTRLDLIAIAPTETLRWTVGDTTLTATVAIPLLAP